MRCRVLTLVIVSLRLCMGQMASDDAQADHFKEAEEMYDRIQKELKNKYDRRIRPFIGAKPVEVDVFLYVSSLRSISEATMDYKLELYFREYWQDPRMAYNPKEYQNMTRISLHESYADLIWVPDTFLPNAVHSENPDHRSITHRALLRLEPDGHLLYSRRLSVTAECPMDLSLYPFDEQVCMLSIESYGYGIDDIVYRWVERPAAIVLNENLRLPDFKIKLVMTKSHNVTLATGTYSRLEACFFFVRSSAFYFVQLFIPATAIVVTSWLSLWMEGESTFSDMVEVILAITFLYYSYNTMMPRVSYIKAMDIYLGACFIFVFLSLIKLAILKMMRLHGEHKEWKTFRQNTIRRSPHRPVFESSSRSIRRNRSRYQQFERDQYRRRYQWAYGEAETDPYVDDEKDQDTFEMINRAYTRNKSPSSQCSVDFLSSTAASTPTTQPSHQSHVVGSVVPTTVLSAPRLDKAASRTALLVNQLSLDSSERYRKPWSQLKKPKNLPGSNGVTTGGRRGRFADLFAINASSKRFASTDMLTSGGARFRKIYKTVWVILFPLSFVGFCVFYFISYFLLSEDKSLTKCQF